MKRLLIIALTALVSMFTMPIMAQNAKQLIDIDPSSFRPVQTGALSGVAIDKIAPDRSKRPCARIKIHVNRMSREDIDRLEVKVIGGNVELTRKQTAYEGNGLVIELTAKEQTRFYLHHEKYGDSNEVMLNLEGNKEYSLKAHLNLLMSIAVATNVIGADVYLDKNYKGVTDENGLLTIEEVSSGKHLIMIKHGMIIDEREVEVSSSRISFRLTITDPATVATSAAAPATSATTATTASAGFISQAVPTAKTYKVGDYYDDGKKQGVVFWVDETGQQGKIVSLMESSKIQWASVESEQKRLIGADDEENGANNMAKVRQIYDWQSKYPAFKWCADLGEGWYLPAIEELKLFTLDKTVHNVVNQTLLAKGGTKIPDIGTSHWYWSSTESDEKYKGLFCAWHVVMISEDFGPYGFKNSNYNRVRAVSVIGKKSQPATTQSTTTAAPVVVSGSTSGPYKVGDYYNENGKEGVVFWVDETGQHGKIVSLTETSRTPWASDEKELKILIGADDKENGANNMAKVQQIYDWQSKYPAFKWCADLGEGWYLPAIEELKLFTLDKTIHNVVNQTLVAKGGSKIQNQGIGCLYWSSTERDKRGVQGISLNIRAVYTDFKTNSYYARAVAAF